MYPLRVRRHSYGLRTGRTGDAHAEWIRASLRLHRSAGNFNLRNARFHPGRTPQIQIVVPEFEIGIRLYFSPKRTFSSASRMQITVT